MLSFGQLEQTGELAPIPVGIEPIDPPPAAAIVPVLWCGALVGTMERIDWFDTATGTQAHSTYQFTSTSRQTQIAGSRDDVLQRVTEILQGNEPNLAVLQS
jgi:hypothetical protein